MRGVPKGTNHILDSKNVDHMNDELIWKECNELLESQDEDTDGPNIMLAFAYLADEKKSHRYNRRSKHNIARRGGKEGILRSTQRWLRKEIFCDTEVLKEKEGCGIVPIMNLTPYLNSSSHAILRELRLGIK